MSKFLASLVAFLNHTTKLKVFFEMADDRVKMPFLVYSVISQNNLIGINAINHTKKVLIQLDLYTKDLKSNLFYSDLIQDAMCEFSNKPFSMDAQLSREEGYIRSIIEMEFVL